MPGIAGLLTGYKCYFSPGTNAVPPTRVHPIHSASLYDNSRFYPVRLGSVIERLWCSLLMPVIIKIFIISLPHVDAGSVEVLRLAKQGKSR